MTPVPAVEHQSLRALRWRARAPRLLAGGCVALLALAGLRAAIAPGAHAPAPVRAAAPPDLRAGAFAEAFARAYLTWDPEHPERREQRLVGFLARQVDVDAGMEPAGRRAQHVDWTAVVGEQRTASRTTVVVAVERQGHRLYLAVPVERDARGFLAVAAYPALVGAPATDPDLSTPTEQDVDDPELRAVSERAVRNYLAGERRNLAADLADGAVVSLPGRRLRVDSVESITWAAGRRVAVQVHAADAAGASWTLRYELAVVRHERWYVRALHVNPRSKGVS
jgi:Conjugative transposon protein TcpC